MPYSPANPFDTLFSGANRSYNGMDTKQVGFNQAYNPYYSNGSSSNPITGQWQPITTDSQGAIRVNIGTGITVSVTGVETIVGNVAVTGGQIDVNGFSTLTGQVAQLQVQVAALTGTLTSKWQKSKTAGFATVYGAVTGNVLINKVQGFTKTSAQPSYIQLFDTGVAPSAGSTPDFVVAVQTNNNYFLDLAEAGVQFNNGLQVVNSTTPDVYTALGAADFTSSVVYKA